MNRLQRRREAAAAKRAKQKQRLRGRIGEIDRERIDAAGTITAEQRRAWRIERDVLHDRLRHL